MSVRKDILRLFPTKPSSGSVVQHDFGTNQHDFGNFVHKNGTEIQIQILLLIWIIILLMSLITVVENLAFLLA